MHEKHVCLGGHAVHVQGESNDAKEILDFMFNDILDSDYDQVEAHFTLMPNDNGWKVMEGEKQRYNNASLTDAANFLMGEVVFRLIKNNQHYMAIHAALLSDKHGGILLPGESGNGKSSLSIWMTKNGYGYHTDELVLIKSGSLNTRVFTRPFNIKSHGISAIDGLLDLDSLSPPVSKGSFITMIPHRSLNPNFEPNSPDISRIMFPKYDKDADNTLTRISSAAAGIELMKTHVIARNLPGHGFKQLLDIVKSVPAYKLNYNHFDVLPDLLSELKAS